MITMKAISFCIRLMLVMVCFIAWNASSLSSSSTTSILAFVEAFPLPNTHGQRAAAGHHQSRMVHGAPRHNGKTSTRHNPSVVASTTKLHATYSVELLLSTAVSDGYGGNTITAVTATDADHQAVALLATISDTTTNAYGGLPASGGSDDVGVAVDAILGVSNAGSSVDGVTDVSLALAGVVAVFALLALVALQIMPPPPPSSSSSSSTRGGGTATTVSSTAKSTDGTGAAGMASQATATTTASSASPTTVRKGAVADERGDNGVSGTIMLDDGRPKDDLTIEEDRALKSFDEGDRSGLFASLGRLTARIQSTRAQLQEEQTLREATDLRLREVAEEMRNLEDQYELEQNKLVTVQKQLEATQSDLSKTQRDLLIASATLQKLQEERQSLRKLGRAAITLSKQRLTRRFRKLRGITDDDEETNQ